MGRTTKTLKQIIDGLSFYSYRIQVLDQQRQCPNTRTSQLQSLNLQLQSLKRKFLDLKESFKSKIAGEIVTVEYLCDNHLLKGKFVNLSDEEIHFLYQNFAKWSGRNIKIINIKRTRTFISDIGIEEDVL